MQADDIMNRYTELVFIDVYHFLRRLVYLTFVTGGHDAAEYGDSL